MKSTVFFIVCGLYFSSIALNWYLGYKDRQTFKRGKAALDFNTRYHTFCDERLRSLATLRDDVLQIIHELKQKGWSAELISVMEQRLEPELERARILTEEWVNVNHVTGNETVEPKQDETSQ